MLHVLDIVEPWALATLLFLPVVAFELWLTAWIRGVGLRALARPGHRWAGLATLVFWLVAFTWWVPIFAALSDLAMWLRWFGPKFYVQLALVYRAQTWLTALAALACLLMLAGVTVRTGGRWRLTFVVVVPVFVSTALFAHLALYGGVGGLGADSLADQPGVEKLFHVDELAEAGWRDDAPADAITCHQPRWQPAEWNAIKRVVDHPRGLCVQPDGKSLVAIYGCTWCRHYYDYPTLIRVDLSGETEGAERFACWNSRNVRQVDCPPGGERMLVAPWKDRAVYELDPWTLETRTQFETDWSEWLQVWEPMDVLLGRDPGRLYVGNDIQQAVSVFDPVDGTLLESVDLHATGLVAWGGPIYMMHQHSGTGRLYVVSGPGENLLELDADPLRLRRSLHLDDVVGTALVLDEAGGRAFYQSGLTDPLYEIDLDSFTVRRTLEGEAHARRLLYDLHRDALYVLGHFSGTLFAIDLASGDRVWTVRVGGRPGGLVAHDDQLYVNSFGGVFRVDLATQWGDGGAPEAARPTTRGR